MKTSTVVWVIVVVLIIVGLGWWFVAQAPSPAPASVEQNSSAASSSDQGMQDNGVIPSATQSNSITVTYDGISFTPAQVTIPVGGGVTWIDNSSQMWIASNPHPVHTGYDGTSRDQHCAAGYTGPAPFDQCAAGSNFSFTFTKAGSWGYHDHLNHVAQGTVVVQ